MRTGGAHRRRRRRRVPQEAPDTQYAELRWVTRRARARRAPGLALLRARCCAPGVLGGFLRREPAAADCLARGGPWQPDQVEAVWRDDAYEVPAEVERLADGAVGGLRERGSPAHDGMATRLAVGGGR